MDRACGFYPPGWGFEFLTGYQINKISGVELMRYVKSGDNLILEKMLTYMNNKLKINYLLKRILNTFWNV